MPPIGAVVARNVRAERARLGWRQADLANRLGWSATKVGNVESGVRKVTMDDLPALCGALGVKLIKLLDGADPDDIAKLY